MRWGHKLTIEDAREIRRLHSEGEIQRTIAERFGVSRAAVAKIVHGKTWAEDGGRYADEHWYDGVDVPELRPKDVERFQRSVNRGLPDACWEWTQGRVAGYGIFRFAGKTLKSHRVAYKIAFGPFDESLDVCHKCDNPPCCNPSHLFLGTTSDNMRDAVRKGRKQWKLDWDKIREIRRLYSEEGCTFAELGRRFGVTGVFASRIVRNEVWIDT
jgi:transcriptional regulator with XRE-family HTH domain